jgi:hypothetical protein
MPNYKGHLVGGSVAFLLAFNCIVMQKVSFLIGAEWLCFTLLGSLFPDIDTKSKGQKIFYKIILAFSIFLLIQKRYIVLGLLSILSSIPLITNHRGVCHKLWFVVGIPFMAVVACALFFPSYYMLVFWDAVFFSIGAVSHLWLDLGLKKMLRVR